MTAPTRVGHKLVPSTPPTRREYADADRLLRSRVWQDGDTGAALLRSWITDTRPRRLRDRWAAFAVRTLG